MRFNPKVINNFQSNLFPYDHYYTLYQSYYKEAIQCYLSDFNIKVIEHNVAHFPKLLQKIGHLRASRKIRQSLGPLTSLVKFGADGLAWSLGVRQNPLSSLVGEYSFNSSNRQIKLCIDSADSGKIDHFSFLNNNDIYLKTNYASDGYYDKKVIPFFNCNPLVLPHIKTLRSMRNMQTQYDICFIVRVWGGRNEIEGIEHCIRLLEGIKKARCNKFVLAYLVAGNTTKLADRLRQNGIPSTTRPIPYQQLCKISAQSRLNIIRLGMFQCVPWRMTDLLALGARIVFDQNIKTIWPVPLELAQNYFSLYATTTIDQPIASDDCYKDIPDRLEFYLSNEFATRTMTKINAEYFDNHLAPKPVGKKICEIVCHALENKFFKQSFREH